MRLSDIMGAKLLSGCRAVCICGIFIERFEGNCADLHCLESFIHEPLKIMMIIVGIMVIK